jgi:hypothetical protein
MTLADTHIADGAVQGTVGRRCAVSWSLLLLGCAGSAAGKRTLSSHQNNKHPWVVTKTNIHGYRKVSTLINKENN